MGCWVSMHMLFEKNVIFKIPAGSCALVSLPVLKKAISRVVESWRRTSYRRMRLKRSIARFHSGNSIFLWIQTSEQIQFLKNNIMSISSFSSNMDSNTNSTSAVHSLFFPAEKFMCQELCISTEIPRDATKQSHKQNLFFFRSDRKLVVQGKVKCIN